MDNRDMIYSTTGPVINGPANVPFHLNFSVLKDPGFKGPAVMLSRREGLGGRTRISITCVVSRCESMDTLATMAVELLLDVKKMEWML
jgi:hypothetical protein